MTANDDPDQILAGCKDVAHYLRGVFRFFADYMADQPLCCIAAETLTLSHTVHGYKSTAPYVAAIKDIARPGPNKQAPVERIAHDTLTTIREEVNRLANEIEQEPSPKVAQRLIRQLVYVFLHFAVGTQARLRRIRELSEPNTDPAFEEALNDITLQIASAPFGENLLEAVFNECREIIEDRARPLRRALKRAAKRRRRKRHITSANSRHAISTCEIERYILNPLLVQAKEPISKIQAVMDARSPMETLTIHQGACLCEQLRIKQQMRVKEGRDQEESVVGLWMKGFSDYLWELIEMHDGDKGSLVIRKSEEGVTIDWETSER